MSAKRSGFQRRISGRAGQRRVPHGALAPPYGGLPRIMQYTIAYSADADRVRVSIWRLSTLPVSAWAGASTRQTCVCHSRELNLLARCSGRKTGLVGGFCPSLHTAARTCSPPATLLFYHHYTALPFTLRSHACCLRLPASLLPPYALFSFYALWNGRRACVTAYSMRRMLAFVGRAGAPSFLPLLSCEMVRRGVAALVWRARNARPWRHSDCLRTFRVDTEARPTGTLCCDRFA